MKPVLARATSMFGLFVLATGVMAAACSAPPAGTIGSGEQDQTDDGDKKLPASSTNPTNPSNTNNDNPAPSAPNTGTTPAPAPDSGGATPPPPPPPSGGQCAAEADMFACFDCCDAAHPGGWQVAEQAFDDCVCQTACAQACGSSYCAGNEPSAACIQCLDNAQQCDDAANTACAANANCAASDACAQASQCETKPE